MSAQLMHFRLYGNDYETRQFTAVRAIELMPKGSDKVDPIALLRNTSIVTKDDKRYALNSRDSINTHVLDPLDFVAPMRVLSELIKQVNEINFGFMRAWKGVKIPARFRGESATVESEQVDPIISQLLQGEAATLRELEEYYSLEDAFKMLDVMASKGVNAALSQESASKKRR